MGLIHRIAHLFGTNTGRIVTIEVDGKRMIGFKCSGCDAIEGVHEPPEWLLPTRHCTRTQPHDGPCNGTPCEQPRRKEHAMP